MGSLRNRFEKGMDKKVAAYSASISFDNRLYRHDIQGSIAWARMLARQGIISDKDSELIVMGLSSIREEISQGMLPFKDELEDIHMHVENRLAEKIGPLAGKLHTGRSRNDQVALDLRLYAKEAIAEIVGRLGSLQQALVDQAEQNKRVILPGYTHVQRAQPVLLAHHLLAYFEMAQRDVERFRDCLKRTDSMPLGSGAVAGSAYPLDRQFLASELGFKGITANSIDAVSDRDFVIEFLAAASVAMMHVSRLAEEVVLWSSAEFSFIELDDAYATSSSIMPQKKNPDTAELARGKTGRVYGDLMRLLTLMKGLPLSYNRDLQEDKEAMFDAADTLASTLDVFSGMIASWRVNAGRMLEAASEDSILATDLADYLVKKGLPFRDAHTVVSKLVRYSVQKGKPLLKLELKELQAFSPVIAEDIRSISLASSLAARNVTGGTAPSQVEAAIARARATLASS